MRQLIENARLREREVGRRQAAVQEAGFPGVEPVEAANLVGERHGPRPNSVVSNNTIRLARPWQAPETSVRLPTQPRILRSHEVSQRHFRLVKPRTAGAALTQG